MRKGGYQIIDLHDTNFTAGEAQTVADIYDKIEGSYRKPLLLSGLTVEDVEYPDTYVEVTVNESAYEITAYGKQIKIDSTDEVTVTAQE